MKSPILFLIFNRPITTEKVFQEIRKAKPPRLYVAADGPRTNRDNEKELCELTRSIATKVDWPCKLETLFREENLGCGKAVSDAITWFFSNESEGIILEDDILPHPDFFQYCDELLEKYRDNPNIQLITGRNNFFKGYESEYSYYMSSYFHIWGWATWRRVWNTYELDASSLSKKLFIEKLKERIPEEGVSYWDQVFDMMADHRCDTWDYQLYFNQILNDRYSLVPYINVTRNIGFGEDATHTSGKNANQERHSEKPILPLIHPFGLHTDKKADKIHMNNMNLIKRSVASKIIKKIWQLFS
ncbi:MAG: nucleotide-diphospho-sugar transferase [Muribaculaceae bacterium]|nr:nucleotide-diphospho-sugar transferase [Muribaculaceae bacterium]